MSFEQFQLMCEDKGAQQSSGLGLMVRSVAWQVIPKTMSVKCRIDDVQMMLCASSSNQSVFCWKSRDLYLPYALLMIAKHGLVCVCVRSNV